MSSRDEASPARRTGRLLKLVSELQEEIEHFEAELERQAERESEAKAAARIEQRIKEAEETVRRQVQQDLLTRFEVEIAKLNIGFEQRLRQTIVDTEAAAEAKLQEVKAQYESQLAKLTAAAQEQTPKTAGKGPKSSGRPDVADAVRAEISRIETAVQDLAKKVNDPKTELSAAMRLNRELSELSAYLKGLRYSIGEPIV